MTDRLVVGSGSLVHTIAESLADRPGTVRVLTDDEQYTRTVSDDVSVRTGDPTDPGVLEAVGPVDIVAIVDDDTERNAAIGKAVRREYPDAYVIVYTDWTDHSTAGDVADTVLSLERETAIRLLDRIGQNGQRAQQLLRTLRDLESLAVVTHDNPDPDAIGSGLALARLGEMAGCSTTICYFGEITHQENRAFVNLLDIEMRNLTDAEEITEFDGVALVDHSRPGVNDQLPEELSVDIVIDHHPPNAPVDARFVDLRSDVGSTSTLLVDYFERFGLEFDKTVATALLFGIRVDTKAFSREVSEADFEAAATLVPSADLGMLERIESPSLSPRTLDIIAQAIDNRQQEGPVLLSCVGNIGERDALAQAADRLLNLEDVTTSLVYGVIDGTIHISARSRGTDIDLGQTLRDAFDQIGSAGGHENMAGAQIPLGLLEETDADDESLIAIVEAVVADRFLETYDAKATRILGQYRSESDIDAAFLRPDEREEGDRSGTGIGTEADEE